MPAREAQASKSSAESARSGGPHYFRYFPLSPRDRKWGLFVTTSGETQVRPGEDYPPPGHPKGYHFQWSQGRVLPDHQVVYVSKGAGWFESTQVRKQRIEAGSVFLLFPGVWHRYTPDREIGWTEHWVGFQGPIARSWVRLGFFSPQDPIIRPVQEEVLLPLYTGMAEAIKKNQPALQQILAGMLAQIVGWVYSAQQTRAPRQSLAEKAIHLAIERMQQDIHQEINLPQLAADLGFSYSWLRRTFTAHTGLSPHQYLLELRLMRARNLLSQTDLTVKEISREAGFEDEHYFCRLFRRKTGSTPSRWRAVER